ncbi:MAG TPA: Wzz/FepE/Etk N-terminal domain-containing protein [Aliidongia sp.]|nr:Wzz/FepE/Etk N-terminal domain-containing protein [Aliidongia sp.]
MDFAGQPDLMPREADSGISLSDLVSALWRRKLLIISCGIAGLAAGVLVCSWMKPVYRATMTIAAMPAPAGSRPAGSVVATLAGLSSSTTQANFQQLVEALTSNEVAGRIAAQPELLHAAFSSQWKNGEWARPTGFRASLSGWISSISGRPGWHPPARDEVAALIGAKLTKTKVLNDIYELSFDMPDRDAAEKLLSSIVHEADTALRTGAGELARSRIDFIQAKISDITFNDQRQVLTQSMSDAINDQIMAESKGPYAARIVDPAHSPINPHSPSFILFVIAGVFLGLATGAGIAFSRSPSPRR